MRNMNATAHTAKGVPFAMNAARSVLQRRCACGNQTHGGAECRTCGDERKILPRRATDALAGEVPEIVHEALRSPGAPLDAPTQAFMEPRFGRSFAHVRAHADPAAAELRVAAADGPLESEAERVADAVAGTAELPTPSARHDLSRIRVHTDAAAVAAARAVHADAFTVGQHLVFDAGRYSPNTHQGRHLLAHELAHSMQQESAPRLRRRLSVDSNQPAAAPAGDPAAGLSAANRFA